MQFSCESCKATLHIGDDKVKGKRLVVRCKRCSNRIQIADPALGPAPAGAAPLATAAVLSPVAKPAPKPAPAPRPEEHQAVGDDGPRDSDTEDTRAMESDLLEKALQASKRDDLSSAGMAPVSAPAPRSPPPARPPGLVRDGLGPADRADEPRRAGPEDGLQHGHRAHLRLEGGHGGLAARRRGARPLLALRASAGPQARASAPPPAKTTPPAQKSAPKSAPVVAAAPRSGGIDFSTQDFGSLDLGGEGDKALSLELEGPAHRSGVSAAPKGEPEPVSAKATVPGRPGAKSAPVLAAVEAKPAPEQSAVSGISLEGLSPVGKGEPDDEERTNVEALPLGERVHQEKVANELFSSGEVSGGVSAMDLAKWASSELGKKPPASAEMKRPGPPLMTPPAQSPAPAAGAPKADPFSNVPDAPGLLHPDKADTTGKVLARSGVHKSRMPTVLAVVFACCVVVAVLGWALLGGEPHAEVAPAPQEVARPSVGGTGDTQGVGQLVAKDPAQKPAAAPKKVAAADPKAAEKAQDQKAAALTQEQAEALKQLDNERGVGNHGPKADAAPAVPVTSSGDNQLSPADIRKKLFENKGALQSCIEDALKKDPAMKVGKVKIKTAIAPSGAVTATSIDKQKVDESALGACLKRAIKRIVFPSFAGEAFEVDIPLTITAGD